MKTRKSPFSYISNLFKAEIFRHAPNLFPVIKFKNIFASLNVTDRCNFRCIMCSQWRRDTKKEELSSQEWKDIISQLKTAGINEINFTGGEPLLREDIYELIRHASSLRMTCGITTNGYLLDDDKLKDLIDCGLSIIAISLDGLGNEHDKIRGVEGAGRRVSDLCALLARYRKVNLLTVYLYFTLMKNTLGSYEAVYNFSKSMGVPIVINLLDNTPYFFNHLKQVEDNNPFWIKGKEDLSKLKELQKFFVNRKSISPGSTYHLYSEIDYFRKYFNDPLQKRIPCVVSQQRIGIASNGDVYGGCWSMASYGNLREASLKSIIDSLEYKNAHKKMFLKMCPGCSCGYPQNLRYYLPGMIKEALFRAAPFTRKMIWR